MATTTGKELISREREAMIRSAWVLLNVAAGYRTMLERGDSPNPMITADLSRRSMEAATTISVVLQANGVSAEEIRTLAAEIDRENASLDALRKVGL